MQTCKEKNDKISGPSKQFAEHMRVACRNKHNVFFDESCRERKLIFYKTKSATLHRKHESWNETFSFHSVTKLSEITSRNPTFWCLNCSNEVTPFVLCLNCCCAANGVFYFAYPGSTPVYWHYFMAHWKINENEHQPGASLCTSYGFACCVSSLLFVVSDAIGRCAGLFCAREGGDQPNILPKITMRWSCDSVENFLAFPDADCHTILLCVHWVHKMVKNSVCAGSKLECETTFAASEQNNSTMVEIACANLPRGFFLGIQLMRICINSTD